MRAAAVQLNSNGTRRATWQRPSGWCATAAADGAELVALPEKWNLLADGEELARRGRAARRPEPDRRPRLGARARHPPARRQHRRARRGEGRLNTSVLIGPDGEDLAVYRKIHMFDVDAGGVSYRESELRASRGGDRHRRRSASSTLGLERLLRPALPRAVPRSSPCAAPALLAVPSAFTAATGRDHWEVLLRARAIENQVFVLAPNQVGDGAAALRLLRPLGDRRPLGAACSPRAADGECFVAADLDFADAGARSARRCPRSPTAARRPTLAAAEEVRPDG